MSIPAAGGVRAPFLFLAAAVAAQEPADPFRFVPRDCTFVLRCAGPEAWREAFAGTGLAELLGGPTLAPLLRQLDEQLTAALAAAPADLPIAPADVRKLVEGWSGALLVAVHVETDGLADAMREDRPPAFSGIVLAADDGQTDFGRLVGVLQDDAERTMRSELRDLQVGDHRLRLSSMPDVQFTLPAIVDGHVVALFGSDLEKQAAKFLDAREQYEPSTEFRAGQLAFEARLGGLMTGLQKALDAMTDEQGLPFDAAEVLELSGLMSLDSLALSLGAEGRHTAATISVALNDRPRGLLGVYGVAADAGRPRLLDYVPANAHSFSVSPFRIEAIYHTLAAIWDELGPMLPMTREAGEQALAEAIRVRLKEDLLDHVGGEILVLQGEPAEAKDFDTLDEDEMLAAVLGDMCIALSLRDGKAFAASFETMLRSRGLHTARKTEDYQGEKVHRLRLLGLFEVEYVLTDDLMAASFGGAEGGARSLRALLDERAARRSGEPAPELPAAIRERLRAMPGGWSGLQAMPLTDITNAVSGALPDEARDAAAIVTALGAELRKLGMEHMVLASWIRPNALVTRLRW